MDLKEKQRIWVLLVKLCGANKSQWSDFEQHFPDCVEYRFGGSLGFGGKVWISRERVHVSCYPEDETPERLAAMKSFNDLMITVEV